MISVRDSRARLRRSGWRKTLYVECESMKGPPLESPSTAARRTISALRTARACSIRALVRTQGRLDERVARCRTAADHWSGVRLSVREDEQRRWFTRFFYLFLDVSGILLGIFLTVLGAWIVSGRPVAIATGAVVLFLGLCATFIHTGHYFNWKIARKLFGSDYFMTRSGK